MRRLVLLAAVLALAGTLAHAPNAWACTCVVPGTPQQLFSHADAVFVGTVSHVSTPDSNGDVVAQMSVTEVYKGTVPGSTGVHTVRDVADCGVAFVRGARYAVFAKTTHGFYRADICTGTTSDTGVLARAGYHPGSPASPVSAQTADPPHVISRTGPLAGAALLIVVIAVLFGARRRARASGSP
jgi:hypothetical protein